MTVPPGVRPDYGGKVSDMVSRLFPRLRGSATAEEESLAEHLRGNRKLFESLKAFIEFRIGVRAKLPVPSDPVECKAWMECDRELRALLFRLEAVYYGPDEPAATGEQPE